MKLRLVAVGTRLATWQQQGYEEYAKRMPSHLRLELSEIPAAKRGHNEPPQRIRNAEGRRIVDTLEPRMRVLSLDERGSFWSTPELARRVEDWLDHGRDVALLIGGAEGLSDECLERSEQRWSLSPLTLPHGLVRVVVAEQLYRAWTVICGHPYHRGSHRDPQ